MTTLGLDNMALAGGHLISFKMHIYFLNNVNTLNKAQMHNVLELAEVRRLRKQDTLYSNLLQCGALAIGLAARSETEDLPSWFSFSLSRVILSHIPFSLLVFQCNV